MGRLGIIMMHIGGLEIELPPCRNLANIIRDHANRIVSEVDPAEKLRVRGMQPGSLLSKTVR